MKFLWNAVETEKNLKDSPYAEPLGFPGKDSKMVSSFETQGQTDREQFINALEFMSRHKKWAHAISKRKDMNLGSRIDYVEHHGMNVYGSVVTKPTKEIERLLKNKTVKAANIGEVELWNW